MINDAGEERSGRLVADSSWESKADPSAAQKQRHLRVTPLKGFFSLYSPLDSANDRSGFFDDSGDIAATPG